jgi:cytochrome c oxidase subunit IV
MMAALRASPAWAVLRPNLLTWLALLVLLAITLAAAYVPMGSLNIIVSLGIATTKSLLVGIIFMNLRSSSALLRLASLSGFFLLLAMMALTFADYLTRSVP